MRKSTFIVSAVLGVTSLLAAAPAWADDDSGAISVGARVGYGIPLGKASDTTNGDLSSGISGMIPLQLDAGYKFTPNIYVGAYFMYGLGFVSSDQKECSQNGVSCSVHDMRFGINAHYHLMPDQTIDPWFGVGVGYEILGFSASGGGADVSSSTKGFEFITLEGGADYKVMPNLGVGPFLSFSLGKYTTQSIDQTAGGTTQSTSGDIQQTAFHEWLMIGVRGAYDIPL